MTRALNILAAVFLLITLSLSSAGCKNKGCSLEPDLEVDQDQLALDIERIDQYLSAHEITAQTHPSGLRYVINREGSGTRPTVCDYVLVTYIGRLASNNEIFDQRLNNPIGFSLERLITGWQIGIPLIKTGGSITLYVPSVYGYGSSGNSEIPPNSNLIFNIGLRDIN